MTDPINHPAHYTSSSSGVECIHITEHLNFCLGNAVKYLWRQGLKGAAVEDWRKADWYTAREIQRVLTGEVRVVGLPHSRRQKLIAYMDAEGQSEAALAIYEIVTAINVDGLTLARARIARAIAKTLSETTDTKETPC